MIKSNYKISKIVCFGEVLWDVFPTHKKIGGAPLNVALRLHSLDNDVYMVSKVGNDENGTKLLDYLKSKGLNSNHIQIDDNFKTGTVKVMLDSKGSATYDIEYPRSWDKIKLTDKTLDVVSKSDAFYYGSLVARDDQSKSTLLKLLDIARFKVFDLNLRPPHYSTAILYDLMKKADFIKLNDDELFEVSKALGSKYNSIEQNVKFIANFTNSKYVCITKGNHGALLFIDGNMYYNSGYKIKVADTVGAGDSFFGSLISKLLKGRDPQEAIDFACAVGALVAGSKGANPDISTSDIDRFMSPYN